MTIFVDQDNTLNDFIKPVVQHVRNWFGIKHFNLRRENCKTYHLLKYAFPRHEVDAATEEMFSIEGFWETMPIQPDAAEVMERLCRRHDVYILTCPWPTSKNCIPEKIEWVKKNLPFFNLRNMIFSCNKSLLHGDVLIDDAPHYLNSNNAKTTIAFDYPYNRSCEADYRAATWLEIERIIGEIE